MDNPKIVVIGSGVAGILMGIKLAKRGFTDFVILEKADRLGGTWRDNVYPGIACDVAAHLYVYSFEPNPNWRRRYATGPQLWDYFNATARKYGVLPHMRFGEEAASAEWLGARWRVRTKKGLEIEADIVVTCVGRLHHPVMPEIKGLEDFEGAKFHSARWDSNAAVDGKRVGVIGTGSTATQITVALAGRAAKFSLFQRTAQWVMPIADEPVPLWKRLWFRLNRQAMTRYYHLLASQTEAATKSVRGEPAAVALRDKRCLDGLATVRDPVLRAKLTPDYAIGCKRMVISEKFYAAVQHPNVDVVTQAIDHVEAKGVVTADGKLHPLDVLVVATGFNSQAYLRPMTLTGDGGVKLDEVWQDVALNYRSVAIPHMPNFFMVNGPYSPGGSASLTGIIETHVGYVMQCIERVVTRDVAIMPREERARELLQATRERARDTVWATGGCQSWYLDKTGTPTIDPIPLSELSRNMAVADFRDFDERPLQRELTEVRDRASSFSGTS